MKKIITIASLLSLTACASLPPPVQEPLTKEQVELATERQVKDLKEIFKTDY